MKIPLVDLALQHAEIEAEVRAGFERVMAASAYVLGPDVAAFENEYAAFCGSPHCIGTANGTDALELAIRALGVGPGDEVVLPANTFIASALAVLRAGAAPVLVDCEPTHYGLDVGAALDRIGPRTRALMAVDLFGQLADFASLEEPCRAAGVALVEDAAQSQGASFRGRVAGTFGDVAGTSFYPGKNLGAYGDAGAVVTRRDDLAARVRQLRNYGSDVKYHHPEQGFNSRLDTLQAVVLRAKLARLPGWNVLRSAAADRYRALLSDAEGIGLPSVRPGHVHVWHIYAVRVAERDRVIAQLHAEGIGAGIHYPVPIHLQGAFADLGHRPGDFPHAERAAAEMISLPIYPGITSGQQEQVAEALRRAVARGGSR